MYAQRIAQFLKRDPQVRDLVKENFLSGKPTLREPLPALWVEDLAAEAGQPPVVRLHAYAAVYQESKALVRTAVRALEFFENEDDAQPAFVMDTDDFNFHPKEGVTKLAATRSRYELTQDLEIAREEAVAREPQPRFPVAQAAPPSGMPGLKPE